MTEEIPLWVRIVEACDGSPIVWKRLAKMLEANEGDVLRVGNELASRGLLKTDTDGAETTWQATEEGIRAAARRRGSVVS